MKCKETSGQRTPEKEKPLSRIPFSGNWDAERRMVQPGTAAWADKTEGYKKGGLAMAISEIK